MKDVPLILTQSIYHKCKVIRLCYVTFTRAKGRGREAPRPEVALTHLWSDLVLLFAVITKVVRTDLSLFRSVASGLTKI